MNAKQRINIVGLGALVIGVSHWTGYVHGGSVLSRQEMFVSLALPTIVIWTLAKLTFGLFLGRVVRRREVEDRSRQPLSRRGCREHHLVP